MKFIGQLFEYLIDEIIKQLYGLIPVNIQMLISTVLVFLIILSILYKYRNDISVKWFIVVLVFIIIFDPTVNFLLINENMITIIISKLFFYFSVGFIFNHLSSSKIISPVLSTLTYLLVLLLSNLNYLSENLSGDIIHMLITTIFFIMINLFFVFLGGYISKKTKLLL